MLERIKNIINVEKWALKNKSNVAIVLESSIDGSAGSNTRLAYYLLTHPVFFKERELEMKIQYAFQHRNFSNEDRKLFKEKITVNGMNEENAKRILYALDRAETFRKVDYIRNIILNCLYDRITIQDMFRLLNTISNVVDEDLAFARDNIGKSDIDYCMSIPSLVANGIMYVSYYGKDGRNKHSFTLLGQMLDNYAFHNYEDGFIPEIKYKEPIYFDEVITGNVILNDDEHEKVLAKELGNISAEK